jgi:hypothetical protein
MKKFFAAFFGPSSLAVLFLACMAPAQTNIAPTGQGYYWYGMKSATVTTNQTATSLINDGNVSNTLNCDATGETSTNRYEGAGVIFSSAQSNITSVAFINGPLDANGNGNFEANLSLQTYNGSAWSVASGWTVSPAYPYTTAAAGKTYTFTGPTLNNVLGVRVVGEVRVAAIDNSWSWTVNEVKIYASSTQSANFTLSASPSSQSVTAGSTANYTVTVTPQNGFTGTVNLTVSGEPSGWTPTLSPTSISGGSGSSTLQVATTSSATPGTYTLTVKGTSGSLVQTASIPLTVNSQSGSAPSGWMGYSWNIDPNGTCIGGCEISSNSSNLSVDANGYLHVQISKSGSTWTGAEMFTSSNLGFGTYQWVIRGNNFYNMDPPVVLGLFTYGPQNGIGTDGTNEVDIEFSKWGTTGTTQNVDFTVYPATGHKNKNSTPSSDTTYYITPPGSGATTTVRFVWSSTSINWYVMSGTVGVNAAPTNVVQSFTYNGTTSTIPQAASPVGINFWAFEALPTNAWNVVLQSFTYHQ